MQATISNQMEIADKVMWLFREIDVIKDVYLRGSLSTDTYDIYSDIDIGIDVSGSDNAEFTQTMISVMQHNFDIYFYDWATGLLPDSYVISFFPKGVPIFWQIDLSCNATPHIPTLTRQSINNDPIAHLIKLWVIHAKYIVRGKVHENLFEFGRYLLGSKYLECIPSKQLLELSLNEIEERAKGKFTELINECKYALQDVIL